MKKQQGTSSYWLKVVQLVRGRAQASNPEQMLVMYYAMILFQSIQERKA